MGDRNRQTRSQDPPARRIVTGEVPALSDDTLARGRDGHLGAIAIGRRAGDLELERVA
jgi:hypothetical protein